MSCKQETGANKGGWEAAGGTWDTALPQRGLGAGARLPSSRTPSLGPSMGFDVCCTLKEHRRRRARQSTAHVARLSRVVRGVWCSAVRCGVGQCGSVCGAVRCGAVLCGAVRCGAVRCGAVWCTAQSDQNQHLRMNSPLLHQNLILRNLL